MASCQQLVTHALAQAVSLTQQLMKKLAGCACHQETKVTVYGIVQLLLMACLTILKIRLSKMSLLQAPLPCHDMQQAFEKTTQNMHRPDMVMMPSSVFPCGTLLEQIESLRMPNADCWVVNALHTHILQGLMTSQMMLGNPECTS